MPPRLILAEARVTAEAAGSVHVAGHGTTNGVATKTAADSSASASRVTETMSNGAQQTSVYVGGAVYLDANLAALTRLWSVPGPQAGRFANRWLTLPRGTQAATAFSRLATPSTFFTFLSAASSLTKTALKRLDGRLVIGVKGKLAAVKDLIPATTFVLYIAASGPPLPLSFQENSRLYHVGEVFSAWRERVRVAAPAGAVPFPAASPPPTPTPTPASA
jgi:hypothetical protein